MLIVGIRIIYYIYITTGVKKDRPRTKVGLAEKDVKSNGGQGLLVLIGLKVLVMKTSLQNNII